MKMPNGPTESPTLTAKVLEHLRNDIVNCRLLPGDRLRFADLRNTYGVGLSPLREALSRLTAEGLVIARGQRGFTVAAVSLEDLQDLVRLRLKIESIALSDAIENGDDDWESDVVSTCHRLKLMGDPLAASDNRNPIDEDEWARRHQAFHMALLGGCKSPRLSGLCRSLLEQSERYRRLVTVLGNIPRDTRAEHEALAHAALQRQTDTAIALLHQHISLTAEAVAAIAGKAKKNLALALAP